MERPGPSGGAGRPGAPIRWKRGLSYIPSGRGESFHPNRPGAGDLLPSAPLLYNLPKAAGFSPFSSGAVRVSTGVDLGIGSMGPIESNARQRRTKTPTVTTAVNGRRSELLALGIGGGCAGDSMGRGADHRTRR